MLIPVLLLSCSITIADPVPNSAMELRLEILFSDIRESFLLEKTIESLGRDAQRFPHRSDKYKEQIRQARTLQLRVYANIIKNSEGILLEWVTNLLWKPKRL